MSPWAWPLPGTAPLPAEDPKDQPWGHVWDDSKGMFKATLKEDQLYTTPAGNVCLTPADWAAFIIAHMHTNQGRREPFPVPGILNHLNLPSDALTWGYDRAYFDFWKRELGWPLDEAGYAFGWFATRAADGSIVLNHGGTSNAFQAQVYLSPVKKAAILLMTNARQGHIHLYRTALKIRERYGMDLDLP